MKERGRSRVGPPEPRSVCHSRSRDNLRAGANATNYRFVVVSLPFRYTMKVEFMSTRCEMMAILAGKGCVIIAAHRLESSPRLLLASAGYRICEVISSTNGDS